MEQLLPKSHGSRNGDTGPAAAPSLDLRVEDLETLEAPGFLSWATGLLLGGIAASVYGTVVVFT